MRRIIALLVFYFIQFALMVLFLVPSINEFTRANLSFLVPLWDFYKAILGLITKILHLDFLAEVSSRLSNMVSSIILNLFVTVVYFINVLIIVGIANRVRIYRLKKRKLNRYSLSEEEKAKFDYKLYERKISIKGIISYIIPLIIVLLFLFIRFDKNICENDVYREGYFNVYNSQIKPFLHSIHSSITDIIDAIALNYIYFVDKVIEIIKINVIEYVFIFTTIFILFVSWSFGVFVASKINHKHAAKRRAYKARKKYINKMEKYELKAKSKAEDRISSKAKEIVGEENTNNVFEDASPISLVAENINGINRSNREKEAEYIDDISTGVTDLGIASSGVEEDEPIERKIPIFIDDEDVDIVLEKEAFVEIEEDYDNYEEDVMPFFEKYSPELMDYSYIDESLLETQIEVEDEENHIDEESFAEVKEFVKNNEIVQEVTNIEEKINVDSLESKFESASTSDALEIKDEIVQGLINVEKNKNIKPIRIEKVEEINCVNESSFIKESLEIKPIKDVSKTKKKQIKHNKTPPNAFIRGL